MNMVTNNEFQNNKLKIASGGSRSIHLMLEFLKAPFLVLHFSSYTLMTFLMMLSVMLLSMLMILKFTAELESDVQDTGMQKWLVVFNAGKTQPVLFDWCNNTGTIDIKMDLSNHLLKCWGCLSL